MQTRYRLWLSAATIIALLVLAACQPITATPGTVESVEAREEPTQAVDLASMSAVEQQLAARATEELAQELGVSPDEIAVVAVEAVEWRDASLGCPQPDTMYAQVITPGYRIVLQAGDETYEVHASTQPDSPLVHCEE